MNDDAPFTALLVHWSRPAEAALPKFRSRTGGGEEVRRYKSVSCPRRMVGGETGPRTGRAWKSVAYRCSCSTRRCA